MKRILLFALLALAFHSVVAQVHLPTNKIVVKSLSQVTSETRYRNQVLLKAYEPEQPTFNFDLSSQGNKNPDTIKKIHICTCSTPLNISPPLILILSRKRSFKVDSFNDIQVKWIKSLSVLKDSTKVYINGQVGQNGVVLITVNDDAYPSVYRQLKRTAKPYLIPKSL